MYLHPYLNFNGDCAEAFQAYERILGGKIEGEMTWGQMPPGEHPISESMKDRVMHISMHACGSALMGSDVAPNVEVKKSGFHLSLSMTDVFEAERLFSELSDGGTVEMPLKKTFWAERFGMLTDRWGTKWMINCGQGA